MKPEEGGSWFFLVVHRPDKKYLVLDQMELSSIPANVLAAITAEMKIVGITPALNDSGEWCAFGFDEAFFPYNVPPCLHKLAKYIQVGTVITLDNGCWPSAEWHFNGESLQAIDPYDSL
ncbi:MAG TPA: hypothetical protein VGD52_13855 [Pseudoduganella sp.]